jgi:hypothetical protein
MTHQHINDCVFYDVVFLRGSGRGLKKVFVHNIGRRRKFNGCFGYRNKKSAKEIFATTLVKNPKSKFASDILPVLMNPIVIQPASIH